MTPKCLGRILALLSLFVFVDDWTVTRPRSAAGDCPSGTETTTGSVQCFLYDDGVTCVCNAYHGCPSDEFVFQSWECMGSEGNCAHCTRTRGVVGYYRPCEPNWNYINWTYCIATDWQDALCNDPCFIIDRCESQAPRVDLCGGAACSDVPCRLGELPIEPNPNDPMP
ncbi:MAG: hypothetical protein L6Q92_16125 [Phycisphaerae bacterium]|nr:hypothetical protein [Phycisphaerae bacterium]